MDQVTAKRHCGVPTPAMALDHLRLCIVQCFHSHQDAVAFLCALPSLDGPLRALLMLLTTSSTFRDQWPAIVLEDLNEAERDLARAALPAIPAIHIKESKSLACALSGRYSDLGTFITAWPTKVTLVRDRISRADVERLRCLQHCTRLDYVSVYVDAFGTLLPSLPSSVRHVTLVDDSLDLEYTPDDRIVDSNLAVTLRRWLENGQSKPKHVSFECDLAPDDAAAVGDVLVSASHLTTLKIWHSAELVTALIATPTPLPPLTRFAITMVPKGASHLVSRLNFSALTHLDVEFTDLSGVLPLLPSMINLRELTLVGGALCEMPSTLAKAPISLRALALRFVDLASEALDAFLRWLFGLHRLHSVTVYDIFVYGQSLSLRQIAARHWTLRTSFLSTALNGRPCGVLQDTSTPKPNTVDEIMFWALARAVSHLVNTTVEVSIDFCAEKLEDVTRQAEARYGVRMTHRSATEYGLHSPTN
ncbi:hypothetical protein SDRG_17405 [Saprolegnia diclina VS20]|uniref:F-box domain-containing protein n=1 Tax=Saprolegnia diclina (strain VS20) TaxID=1156394 RepID=T0R5A1_SAPDV|nr:hypothetical protein SDRG_17405 [Saprolegnia diclina VS20]EQC24702.1 hypothetical protein SDRG_17405 [Saprolegnia diclina VS20]|eukprot:XP_008621869.1 hypothetical protein SDRG_17405 [Saprolegnia diclina VS20]